MTSAIFAQTGFRRSAPLIVCLLALTTTPSLALAQDSDKDTWLENRFPFRVSSRRDNGPMMSLVKPLCEAAGQSTVQVFSNNKAVALGIVVSKDGLIVTKRSELSGDPIRVRFPDKRYVAARVAAVRREADLALLDCDIQNTTPAEFHEATPEVGSFLVSVARGGRPMRLGAVSVAPRPLPAQAKLGVRLIDDRQGTALVDQVFPFSGAEEAGIQSGDKILAIDGRSSNNSREVTRLLQAMFPGESVRLTIARDGDTVELDAQIRDANLLFESENDARLNGPRSKRFNGFDLALQHDTVLDTNECGGPVVDSKGRVVGLNIARAGRVVSYALPSSLIRPLVDSMIEEAGE